MATIKLTPFLLFLLLLIVLVISVIFGNRYSTEGFINFNNDKSSINQVLIPQYSKTKNVTKIYDNIFFDQTNGNLIELDASGLTGGAKRQNNLDTDGSSINNILVTPRDSKYTSTFSTELTTDKKVIPQNVDIGLKDTTDKSYKSYSYTSQCKETDKSSTFYIPWGTDTYVITIQPFVNASNVQQVNGVITFFGAGNSINNVSINNITYLERYYEDNDVRNGNSVIDRMYDSSRNILQISKYVKYDKLNSNLIIQSGDNSNKKLTVYDKRINNTSPTVISAELAENVPNTVKPTDVPNVGFNAWNVYDACGQNIVFYSCVGLKTVVALAAYKDNSMRNVVLRNVLRFSDKNIAVSDEPPDSTNVATPTTTVQNVSSTSSTTDSSTTDSTISNLFQEAIIDALKDSLTGNGSNCPISDYYNMKSKYNCNNSETEFDDRYILKSQIVPPVCPSCPACASCAASSTNETCTNCGGNGGSGTLTTDGKSVVDNKDTRTNLAGAISNIGTGATDLAGNVVDKAGNIVDKAGNIISGAGTGAASLLRDTGTGATSLLKDTASGATDLLKTTASEAKKLLTEAGKGVKDIIKDDDDDDRYRYGYYDYRYRNNGTVPMILGTQNQYTDQYSYYGTLPYREGSSYMPITSDFSSFRR